MVWLVKVAQFFNGPKIKTDCGIELKFDIWTILCSKNEPIPMGSGYKLKKILDDFTWNDPEQLFTMIWLYLNIDFPYFKYSKNPHKRSTIFRSQAGKGSHLTGLFSKTVGRGRSNVIKLWLNHFW